MNITICPSCGAECKSLELLQCDKCSKTICENCVNGLNNVCSDCVGK